MHIRTLRRRSLGLNKPLSKCSSVIVFFFSSVISNRLLGWRTLRVIGMNLNPKPSAKRRIGKLAALSIRETKRNGRLVLQLPPAREKRNVPSKTPRTRNLQHSPQNNRSKTPTCVASLGCKICVVTFCLEVSTIRIMVTRSDSRYPMLIVF